MSRSFERFAGLCAGVAAVGGLAYSAAFMTFLKSGSSGAAKLSSFLLMLGGLVVTAVMVGVFARVREADPMFALWAVVLGLASGVGTAVHGAYDLANFIKPPARLASDLPNAVDPRGLLTFGLSGLALIVVAWLMTRGGGFPRRLAYLGAVSGALLIVVYLGRLIILNPKNPLVLTAAIITGFLTNPIWFGWVGRELWLGVRSGGTPGGGAVA